MGFLRRQRLRKMEHRSQNSQATGHVRFFVLFFIPSSSFRPRTPNPQESPRVVPASSIDPTTIRLDSCSKIYARYWIVRLVDSLHTVGT